MVRQATRADLAFAEGMQHFSEPAITSLMITTDRAVSIGKELTAAKGRQAARDRTEYADRSGVR
jgi:hypothetical protein